jgi:hypothetical protein
MREKRGEIEEEKRGYRYVANAIRRELQPTSLCNSVRRAVMTIVLEIGIISIA